MSAQATSRHAPKTPVRAHRRLVIARRNTGKRKPLPGDFQREKAAGATMTHRSGSRPYRLTSSAGLLPSHPAGNLAVPCERGRDDVFDRAASPLRPCQRATAFGLLFVRCVPPNARSLELGLPPAYRRSHHQRSPSERRRASPCSSAPARTCRWTIGVLPKRIIISSSAPERDL